MNNVADVTLTGGISGDYFGISVSSAGDINGDGFDDVIVGANRYSSSRGRAYIFYGGSSMNNVADVTITGATGVIISELGSKAGDFNGGWLLFRCKLSEHTEILQIGYRIYI